MRLKQSFLWKGRDLNLNIDGYGKKDISMFGSNSILCIPIEAEENSTYLVSLNLKNESGNGVLNCNIFCSREFNFGCEKIKCNDFDWTKQEVMLNVKNFQKGLPLYLRLWRTGAIGNIRLGEIIIKYNGPYISPPPPPPPVVAPLSIKEVESGIMLKSFSSKRIIYENPKDIFSKEKKETILYSGFPNTLNVPSNNEIYVFSPYYIDEEKERVEEIDDCVTRNLNNSFISKIYLFSDTKDIPVKFICDKIEVIYSEQWTTYNQIIKFINSNEKFKKSYNIISNSDMYFDDTISMIKKLDLKDSCVALSVWGEHTKAIFNEVSAQGAWIFKGHIKEFAYIIPMGTPGCDNRILFELLKKKYTLYNICYDIIVMHKHKSEYRKYNCYVERVPRPYVMLWSNRRKAK